MGIQSISLQSDNSTLRRVSDVLLCSAAANCSKTSNLSIDIISSLRFELALSRFSVKVFIVLGMSVSTNEYSDDTLKTIGSISSTLRHTNITILKTLPCEMYSCKTRGRHHSQYNQISKGLDSEDHDCTI